MALATYADLLAAIQAYEVDTSSIVTGIQADMVTLAETRIFLGSGRIGQPLYSPALRCRAMERTSLIPIGSALDGGTSGGAANVQTITLDSAPTYRRGLMVKFIAGYSNTGAMTLNANGVGAVTAKKGRSFDDLEDGDILVGGTHTFYHNGTYFVLMPSDGACPVPTRFLGIKAAYLQDRGYILTPQPETGINRFMYGATSAIPQYYAIEGDAIRFDPLPNDDYLLSLTYYARPAALSTSLNDIFREAPSIYLYAALLELGTYLDNPDMSQKMLPLYTNAIIAYQDSDTESKQGYAPMKVRLGLAP